MGLKAHFLYISLRDGILARDQHHVATKSAMLEVADVVYVLAPLGKLLPYRCEEINALRSSDSQGYSKLQNWGENTKKITMIVTTRAPNYLAHLDPPTLIGYFGQVQGELIELKGSMNILEKPFDPLDEISVRVQASLVGEPRALREYELPHKNLRLSLLEFLEGRGKPRTQHAAVGGTSGVAGP